MQRFLALAAVLAASGAEAADWGPPEAVWRLTEFDGTAFAAAATISFPEPGRIAGKAPCNRYSGSQSGSYPAFAAGPLVATKMACDDLAAETEFFGALEAMTAGMIEGEALILADGSGRHMVFQRD